MCPHSICVHTTLLYEVTFLYALHLSKRYFYVHVSFEYTLNWCTLYTLHLCAGVSGRINFFGRQSRLSNIKVMQWYQTEVNHDFLLMAWFHSYSFSNFGCISWTTYVLFYFRGVDDVITCLENIKLGILPRSIWDIWASIEKS